MKKTEAPKAFTPGQEGEPGVNTSFGDFKIKTTVFT